MRPSIVLDSSFGDHSGSSAVEVDGAAYTYTGTSAQTDLVLNGNALISSTNAFQASPSIGATPDEASPAVATPGPVARALGGHRAI